MHIASAQTLHIIAPVTCENGSVCPIGVRASPALSQGQSLLIKVDNEEAQELIVLRGQLSEFSTRLILDEGKSSEVTVDCQGCVKGSARINVTKANQRHTGIAEPVDLKLSSDVMNFRALVLSGGQPLNDGLAYLDTPSLEVAIRLMPRVTANPYFGFKGSIGRGVGCFGISSSRSIHSCQGANRPLSKSWAQISSIFDASGTGRVFAGSQGDPSVGFSLTHPGRGGQRLSVSINQPDLNGAVTLTIYAPIDTVSLKIDGDELGGRADGRYSVQRFAQIGKNSFEVTATDRSGNTQRQTVNVKRELVEVVARAQPLDPLRVPAVRSRDAVAIIIGIENYRRVPSADFANRDASVFYDYARRALGIRDENIRLLVDDKAEATEILRSFKTWLPTHVNKDQTDVYVFYSGHGLPSEDGGSLYFLPHEVDRDLLDRTAVTQKEVVEAIQRTSPKTVTMFIDSCYSGQSRTGETLLASARPISIAPRAAADFPANFTVLSASAPDQISSSSPELRHGIFSYYLMRGMEGEADANKDGQITVAEMQAYLVERVPRRAMGLNRTQQPQVVGDQSKVLVRR
jgi:hypothetical protein